MSKHLKLEDYLTLSGKLCCVTGLRIGSAPEMIEIGGLDNPIIKHPLTGLPYVPGSSLKGKMRTLLEFRYGKIDARGDVHSCHDDNCPICRIFGTNAGEAKSGPSRLIVRDAYLSKESEAEIKQRVEEGRPVTEIKYENTINRITAMANPRQMERVPAGFRFDFEIGFRVFGEDGDGGAADRALFARVVEGLGLVACDTLGGSGSRGYGKVAFEELKLTNLKGEKLFSGTLDELGKLRLP